MRFKVVGLVVVALLVVAAPGWAQDGQRGSGGYIGGFNMIAMPAVQRELNLDEGQKTRAGTVAEQMKSRYEQDMGKLKGLNEEQREKRRVTLAGPHYDEGMRQLRGFLKPAQVDRFDQILTQQRGPMAMLEPAMVKALQVTNAEAVKIATLVADAEKQQQGLVQAAGGKPTQAVAKQLEEIATQANAQAVEVLSPEQKRTWQRIVGEPFRPEMGGGEPAQAPGGLPTTRDALPK